MQKLQNLEISTKIMAAFGFKLFITELFGGTSMQRLSVVNGPAVDMRENWLPATRALGDFGFHAMRARQRAGTTTPTKGEDRNRELKGVTESIADADKAYADDDRTVTAPEERKTTDAVKAGWEGQKAGQEKRRCARPKSSV